MAWWAPNRDDLTAQDAAAGARTTASVTRQPGPTVKQKVDIFNREFAPDLPSWVTEGMPDAKKANYVKRARGGAQGLARLTKLREVGGYGTAEDQLQGDVTSELGKVRSGAYGDDPLHRSINSRLEGDQAYNDVPALASISKYARERLGTGLTPEESAALRGAQTEVLEAQNAEGRRGLANRAAAGGMLQSGATEAAAGQLENQRAQGRVGIERDIIGRDLQRKKEIEDLLSDTARQEAARRAQVESEAMGLHETDLTHEQFLQKLLAGLTDQQEGRYEYDMGLLTARRQAALNRALMEAALRRAEPSSAEKNASIIGGVLGGLGG